MTFLTESERWANQHFVIRVTPNNERSKLVGAGQLHKHIGDELAYKAFERLKTIKERKHTLKLRRGLKIEFCSK